MRSGERHCTWLAYKHCRSGVAAGDGDGDQVPQGFRRWAVGGELRLRTCLFGNWWPTRATIAEMRGVVTREVGHPAARILLDDGIRKALNPKGPTPCRFQRERRYSPRC